MLGTLEESIYFLRICWICNQQFVNMGYLNGLDTYCPHYNGIC